MNIEIPIIIFLYMVLIIVLGSIIESQNKRINEEIMDLKEVMKEMMDLKRIIENKVK